MLPQAVLDAQLSSLKAVNPASFSENVQLHPVTSRYGILTASLLLLNSDFQVVASLPGNLTFPCFGSIEFRGVSGIILRVLWV